MCRPLRRLHQSRRRARDPPRGHDQLRKARRRRSVYSSYTPSRCSPFADVIRAIGEAITIVQTGRHDPARAHARIKTFYTWDDVAARTERVYTAVLQTPQMDLMTRIRRTMDLGPCVGPIYTIILLVDCVFFLFLEWWIPRESLHYVHHHWDRGVFKEVCSLI